MTVSADGTLNPMRTVTLGSELSGIVRKVNVDVNDVVKAGDVLIELDTRNLEASVASARANMTSAEAKLAESTATLNEARLRFSRLKELNKLSQGKMPSRAELDQQEAAVNGVVTVERVDYVEKDVLPTVGGKRHAAHVDADALAALQRSALIGKVVLALPDAHDRKRRGHAPLGERADARGEPLAQPVGDGRAAKQPRH